MIRTSKRRKTQTKTTTNLIEERFESGHLWADDKPEMFSPRIACVKFALITLTTTNKRSDCEPESGLLRPDDQLDLSSSCRLCVQRASTPTTEDELLPDDFLNAVNRIPMNYFANEFLSRLDDDETAKRVIREITNIQWSPDFDLMN